MLLLGQVWLLMRAGTQFYVKIRAQSEVQRDALLALRWLSKDLSEGAPLSFKAYAPDNPSAVSVHPGIVFGSPKDLQEQVQYNDHGRLMWTSVVSYYIDPATKTLFRVKLPLDPPVSRAPTIEDEDYHVDVMAGIPNARTIAHNVVELITVQGPKNIKVDLKCKNEELGYGIKVSTRLEMKNK